MAELIIIHHSADPKAANRLRHTLTELGFEPPVTINETDIRADPREAQLTLNLANIVVVLWSTRAGNDPTLFELASVLLAQRKLCSVLIDDSAPPAVFRREGALSIAGWLNHEGYEQLDALAHRLQQELGARRHWAASAGAPVNLEESDPEAAPETGARGQTASGRPNPWSARRATPPAPKPQPAKLQPTPQPAPPRPAPQPTPTPMPVRAAEPAPTPVRAAEPATPAVPRITPSVRPVVQKPATPTPPTRIAASEQPLAPLEFPAPPKPANLIEPHTPLQSLDSVRATPMSAKAGAEQTAPREKGASFLFGEPVRMAPEPMRAEVRPDAKKSDDVLARHQMLARAEEQFRKDALRGREPVAPKPAPASEEAPSAGLSMVRGQYSLTPAAIRHIEMTAAPRPASAPARPSRGTQARTRHAPLTDGMEGARTRVQSSLRGISEQASLSAQSSMAALSGGWEAVRQGATEVGRRLPPVTRGNAAIAAGLAAGLAATLTVAHVMGGGDEGRQFVQSDEDGQGGVDFLEHSAFAEDSGVADVSAEDAFAANGRAGVSSVEILAQAGPIAAAPAPSEAAVTPGGERFQIVEVEKRMALQSLEPQRRDPAAEALANMAQEIRRSEEWTAPLPQPVARALDARPAPEPRTQTVAAVVETPAPATTASAHRAPVALTPEAQTQAAAAREAAPERAAASSAGSSQAVANLAAAFERSARSSGGGNARARRAAAQASTAAQRARVAQSSGEAPTTLPDGRAYQGEWSEGKANGYGVVQTASGGIYAGAWRNSAPHGEGVMVYANGVRYEGEFANGAPTGHGAFFDPQGQQLEGSALFSALVAQRAGN